VIGIINEYSVYKDSVKENLKYKFSPLSLLMNGMASSIRDKRDYLKMIVFFLFKNPKILFLYYVNMEISLIGRLVIDENHNLLTYVTIDICINQPLEVKNNKET